MTLHETLTVLGISGGPTTVMLDGNRQIRRAVETTYSVRVISVRTQVVRGKFKRLGRHEGKRPNWKKAIVTLNPEDKIEFF